MGIRSSSGIKIVRHTTGEIKKDLRTPASKKAISNKRQVETLARKMGEDDYFMFSLPALSFYQHLNKILAVAGTSENISKMNVRVNPSYEDIIPLSMWGQYPMFSEQGKCLNFELSVVRNLIGGVKIYLADEQHFGNLPPDGKDYLGFLEFKRTEISHSPDHLYFNSGYSAPKGKHLPADNYREFARNLLNFFADQGFTIEGSNFVQSEYDDVSVPRIIAQLGGTS